MRAAALLAVLSSLAFGQSNRTACSIAQMSKSITVAYPRCPTCLGLGKDVIRLAGL